jgi:hypothetical protein
MFPNSKFMIITSRSSVQVRSGGDLFLN